MIFLTQINTYTEIMYSEIIQTHPPNVPHFDPAGILYLSSKASFSHNAIDMSGYGSGDAYASTSAPERTPFAQFRHSSQETGLYQTGIYVNEYGHEMSRGRIPKKLNFAGYFQKNKSSARKVAQV